MSSHAQNFFSVEAKEGYTALSEDTVLPDPQELAERVSSWSVSEYCLRHG